MERALLKAYLDAGLSLERIAALEHCDPSTVGYWVRKHGLVANGRRKHAARGALTGDELRPLVAAGMTVAQIAVELDRSPSTVRYWLAKHGLRTHSRPGRRPTVPLERVAKATEEGQRTLESTCSRHGPATFVIENSGRVRCRKCRMERVAARRRKVKRMLIEEAGGRCERCGYGKFVGALHFHHTDPRVKDFGISQKGATIGIAKLREEAAKCVVLCANCHAEVEHASGDLTLK